MRLRIPSTTRIKNVPYSFGDVLLVPLVFSDATQSKRRPVLVVADTGDADLLVVPVTSHNPRTVDDVGLLDWNSAGLRLPSTSRMAKLATVAKRTVIRGLGRLSERDAQITREALRRFFDQLFEAAH